MYRKFKVGNISYFVKIIIYNLFTCIFQSPQKDWTIFKVSECMLGWFSRFQLFVTLWGIAHQAPLSMGFSRQEYWSGLPCPPPGDLPGPGIEPTSLLPPALAGGFFTTSTTGKAPLRSVCVCMCDSHSVMPDSLWPHSSASRVHWFSRKKYGSGGHSLLQGIFPTQGSKWGLPHCRQIVYHLRPPWL